MRVFHTLNFYKTISRLTACHIQSNAEQTSYVHPQYSLPGQCSCQHVSGSVRISWCLLPHGHPLLGHGWRGSGCHWSWRSYHRHFRWVTEKSSSNANFPEAPESVDGMRGAGNVVNELRRNCSIADGDRFTEPSSWARASVLSADTEAINVYELFIVANSSWFFFSLSSHKHPWNIVKDGFAPQTESSGVWEIWS